MLDGDQKTRLAAVRRLLGAEDVASVRQAFALLDALDDEGLWSVVTAGVQVDAHGNVIAAEGSELARRVRTPLRGEAACWAALHAPHLHGVTRLRLVPSRSDDGPAWPLRRLVAFPALERLTLERTPEAALGCMPPLPALRHLLLEECPVQDLAWLAGATALQTLQVWRSPLVDLSTLPELPALETLSLWSSARLRDLRGLRGRRGLRTLELDRCESLETLDGLEDLTGLGRLTLRGCEALRDLNGLPAAPSVDALDLTDAARLDDLRPLGRLVGLRTLVGRRCASLRRLHGIADLPVLATLDLRECERLATLEGVRDLPALTEARLDACVALREVDALAGAPALTSASLGGCRSLGSVQGLATLRALTSLDLTGCEALEDADGLADLPQLDAPVLEGVPARVRARYTRRRKARVLPLVPDQRKQLAAARRLLGSKDVADVAQALALLDALEDPAMVALLADGVSLDAEGAPVLRERCEVHARVRAPLRAYVALWALGRTPAGASVATVSLEEATLDLAVLERFPAVRTLRLRGCAVAGLAPLRATGIETLRLERMEGLTSLDGLPDSLNTLEMRSCSGVRAFGPLRVLPGLRTLSIEHPPRGATLDAIGELHGLVTLNLLGDDTLTTTHLFTGLGQLETLRLGFCSRLVDLAPLAGMGLRTLEVSRCSRNERPVVAGLPLLEELDLSSNEGLADLSGLRDLPALRRLDVSHAAPLTDLWPLMAFPTLQEVVLSGSGVRDVGPLGELPRLTAIDAGGCAVTHGLEAIARLANLRTLDLSRPMQDTDPAPALEALRGLTGLVELDLSGQPALTDLGILSDMRALRSLSVGNCANLRDVSVLERLTGIERLWMPQCPAIEDAWPVTRLPALRRWSRWNTLSMQSKVVTTVLRERKGCDVS